MGEREAQFQQALLQVARLQRWRVAHFRPARTDKGWRTAVEADGAGFPDLVLVRPPRLIFAELKADDGELAAAQEAWIAALAQVPGVEIVVWRPADWNQICQTLHRSAV